MKNELKNIRLPLGKTVMTRGIAQLAEYEGDALDQLAKAFSRHAYGDWGDVCDEDWELNNEAAQGTGENAGRVLSSYTFKLSNPDEGQDREVKFWVITEWDRAVSTALLPSEY
tara:strand:+ start:299 stop:637 length:339 start_codon:yes stop_codon:yes gene_type:complete